MAITSLNLVHPSSSEPLTPRAITENQLIKIRRGSYLSASSIPQNPSPRQVGNIVTIARALAVAHAMDENSRPEFTLETALILHGLKPWASAPDLTYRRRGSNSRRSPLAMSPVECSGITVSGVTERQLVSPTGDDGAIRTGELWTASFAQIAIDCARYLHPMPAVVAASTVLRWLTLFSSNAEEPRGTNEARRREEMLHMVDGLENRGSHQARLVIEAADAGIKSPHHGYLLWLLHCMLQSNTGARVELVTQHEIKAFGRNYFADFAIPSCGVAIELDIDNDGKQRGTEMIQRHRDMINAGWRIICVGREHLRFPETLIGYLAIELRRCGVRALRPYGGLWRPIPDEILRQASWE